MKLVQVDIPGYYGSPFGRTMGFSGLISIILRNAFTIAGIILLFLLVAGGIGMIAGAGRNDPEAAARGKSAATAAVIGFVIIFASYFIILVVERLTNIQILNVPF